MEDFSKRLMEILSDGMLCLGLIIGHELQLFNSLAAVSSEIQPATSTTVAEKADLKERYVREWLCLMACGKIIEVDESGEKFWISGDRVGELCGDQPNALLTFQQIVLMSAKAYPTLVGLFRKDGPLGMDNGMFDEFDKRMAALSEASHQQYIISKFVPATGLQNKLEEGGIYALDVGCGRGMHIAELGSHYPKCFFTGIDLSLDAVVGANKKRDEANAGLDNVSYMQMNGQMMKDDWTEKFDWVMMFDACHDQTRPDLCLKEIYRVLKSDGLFSMIETDGTSNVYKDKEMVTSTFMYGVSLTHCLPVGMNSEDALGLGAMWGREKAKQLLSAAGFQKIEVCQNPFSEYSSNILYLCYK
uniref:Methyltransferase domain-containing protein n=1 Tax=Setaria digitata TaxID=48799 RepID=A0A915PR10_9BILA